MLFQGGKPPKPPKSVNVKDFLYSLRSRGLTHNHTPAAPWLAQGAFGVAHRQPGAGGSLWTTALPEGGRERLANIHPRATKKSLLNIAKETAHPSVGRSLSAGHHRLILPLCRLRLNAPPQDRLHRSNVTMLARAKPNIPHREPLRTIHTVPNSLVLPQ